jgi:GxxExxY protein
MDFAVRRAIDESKLIEGPLTKEIIGAAIEVHCHLGPGLLESAYEICLCHELADRGLAFRRQVDVPVRYKGVALDCGYKIDILVEDKVILELKALEAILPVHEAQLLTYLKLSGKRVGFLMNFHVPRMSLGILRKVL